MNRLKHWKWQVVVGAPFMPPIYLHYGDWLNTMAKSFGWDSVIASMAPAILMLVMSGGLLAAFVKFHEKDD